jgi:hypothetical protein
MRSFGAFAVAIPNCRCYGGSGLKHVAPPTHHKHILTRLAPLLIVFTIVGVCVYATYPIYQLCIPGPGPLTYPFTPITQDYDESGGSTTFQTWYKSYTVHQPIAVVQGFYDHTLGSYCQTEDPWQFTTLPTCDSYLSCRQASCYSRGWEPSDTPVTIDSVFRTTQKATITLYEASPTETFVSQREEFSYHYC